MIENHTCPRRIEDGMHDATSPFVGAGENLDSYQPGHGLKNQATGCTYCGSMSGDDFMAAVREGAVIDPTEKNYKAYVGDTGKFYYQHLSKEQQHEFINLLNQKKVTFGYPGRFTVLPFFITVGTHG